MIWFSCLAAKCRPSCKVHDVGQNSQCSWCCWATTWRPFQPAALKFTASFKASASAASWKPATVWCWRDPDDTILAVPHLQGGSGLSCRRARVQQAQASELLSASSISQGNRQGNWVPSLKWTTDLVMLSSQQWYLGNSRNLFSQLQFYLQY